jgi:AcrR family transcriptional regulator
LDDILSKQLKTTRYSKGTASQIKHGDTKSTSAGTQRRTRQGIETRQKILDATEEWLITNGYHTFSMGNIANECKISPGNLTYHFPRKELLFLGLVDKITTFYLEGFSRSLSELSQEGSGIEGLMQWLLKDAAMSQTTRLNRELWMLSSHFPDIQKQLSDLYDVLTSHLTELLSKQYPHLSQSKRVILSSLIGVLTEGTCIIYGGRYRGTAPLEELNTAVAEILNDYTET